MHALDNTLILTATDLSNDLACSHLTELTRLTALGLQPRPPKYDDPALEALFARGLAHEHTYLAQRKALPNYTVVELDDDPGAP